MKNKIRRSTVLVLLAVFIGIVILAYISIRLSFQINSIDEKAANTSKVLFQILKIQRVILDKENNANAYLLNPKTELIQQASVYREAIINEIDSLQVLAIGERIELAAIDSLSFYIENRIDIYNNLIRIRKEKGLNEAVLFRESSSFDFYKLKTRAIINQLEKMESGELQTYSNEREAAVRKLSFILFFIFLILVLLTLSNLLQFNIFKNQKSKEIENTKYVEKILASIFDAVIITDQNFKVKSWNRAAEKLYGFDPEKVSGADIASVVRTQVPKEEMDLIRKEMISKKYWNGEVKHLNADGGEIIVQSSRSALLDENGKIYGFVSSNRDVTQKKLADQLLMRFNHELAFKVKEKTNELNNIFERITDAFVAFDNDWNYTFVNQKAEEYLGKTQDQLIGKNIWEVFPDDINKPFYNALLDAKRTQKSISIELYYPSFDRWYKDYIYPSEDGISVYYQDITEKKKAEEALVENEEKYRGLAEQSLTGIYIIQDDKFSYINPQFAKIFGYELEEMLRDVTPAQIVYGTDLKMVSETVNNRLAGEKVKSNYQFRGVKKDGSIIHVEVFGTVTQQAGKPVTIGTLMDVTEKVNAENEIRKSNERFELIGRATNEAIWEWNLETNKVWGNEIHQNLYGLTIKDPVPGDDEWIRRLHPDDKERILETHAKAIASTQKSYTVEYCLFTENKGWMNIFGRTYIERNDSGIPVRLLGTMMDVTDRINADEKIKESEEIRRLIMDSSMDAIICVDIKGAITVWTPQAEKVFGWTKEEVLGKTLTETIIPFQYRERHKEGFSKYLLTGEGPMLRKTFEISALRQNAGEFPVELTIMPIKNGDTEFFCAFIRDITDRKKNEKAIIESEEKYRSLIEQASEPIMIYSFDGSIHEFNKAAVEILGYSHEEFAKLNLNDILIGELIEDHLKYASLMTGNTVTLNRRFKRKNGALLDLEIIARTIPDNKVLAFGRDITERKKNESIIKKEKELSDSIINSLPGIFYIFNQTPKLVRWNKRFEDVSGYSKEELKKLSPLTIFHKDDREEMRQTIEKTYNTGIGETEVRVVTKNGHIIPFILTGTALMYEGIPCIIGTGIDISQRRATEIALAESENFLRTIIDTEPECVKLLGKNGELENMNGAGLEMIEADNLQQVKGHSVINIICEPFRKDFEKLTKNVFKGIPGKLEFEIEGLKGTRRWLETHATPLKNSNGEIVSLLGVTRDITLRKQAEDIILKERDLSDSIINNLPDIFYLFNEKGNFLRWNKNVEKISGYNAEEIKSITPFTLFEDKDKDALHYKLKEVLEKGKSEFDGDLITKKNTRVPYYFKGWKIKYEGKSCIIGIGVDMAIRKEVEEELRKSEEKYKMLFEDNPMPLWMRSLKNHRFIDVNKAAINHYGYSKDEFLEMAIEDIRTKTDSGKPIKTVTPGKEEIVNAGIKNHIKKDGSEIKVDVFGHNTMYGDEEVRLVLAIDVTEKLKAEELLKRSYEDIRRLASHLEQVREEERIGIAREIHDELGQQLTVLKLDLSWLDKRVMDTADEKSREKMNDMLALIDTTVKTVRRISSELRPTILDDLGLITAMEWQVKEFEKRAGIKIIFKTNVGEIDLPVNKSTSLYRIFQESLTNIARHSKASKVNASIIKGKGHIIMTIHDNGQGFDPLIIGNKKTLGILGMKERVNILGGEYFIQSEPGKGTEIRIEVPMSNQT